MTYYIYFDANEGDEKGRFHLGSAGSLEDIKRHGDKLRVGMKVKLLDGDGEFEIDAVLAKDVSGPWKHQWMGVPVGKFRSLVPAYHLRQKEFVEVFQSLRSLRWDNIIELIQEKSQEYFPWTTEKPWWLGRYLLGEVVDVLNRGGVPVPTIHALGGHWRLLLVERDPALVFSSSIADFINQHPKESFTRTRYQATAEVGRSTVEYLRDVCNVSNVFAGAAIIIGPSTPERVS